MRCILHIWKILMWATGPVSMDMIIFTVPQRSFITVGSGTSGSRYNSFKVRLAARNNVYLNYKNMPLFQLVLNSLPLGLGILVKYLLFSGRSALGRITLTV